MNEAQWNLLLYPNGVNEELIGQCGVLLQCAELSSLTLTAVRVWFHLRIRPSNITFDALRCFPVGGTGGAVAG